MSATSEDRGADLSIELTRRQIDSQSPTAQSPPISPSVLGALNGVALADADGGTLSLKGGAGGAEAAIIL